MYILYWNFLNNLKQQNKVKDPDIYLIDRQLRARLEIFFAIQEKKNN